MNIIVYDESSKEQVAKSLKLEINSYEFQLPFCALNNVILCNTNLQNLETAVNLASKIGAKITIYNENNLDLSVYKNIEFNLMNRSIQTDTTRH